MVAVLSTERAKLIRRPGSRSYLRRRWTAISTIDTGISTLKNRCVPGIPGRSSATIHFNGRAIFRKKRVTRAIGKIGNGAPEGIRGTSHSGCDHGRVKETRT
jgi:hypothetical protein